jgi:glycosyltransferase involved in cell wall biosynthesis
LFVIDNINFGGGERAFAQIINSLDREKFEVFTACSPKGLFVEKIRQSAQVIPFDLNNRFNLIKIYELSKAIRRHSIAIVHTQGARADFFGRIAARLSGVPRIISTVATPVEGFDVNPVKKAIYVMLDRFSEKFTRKFIVVSQVLKDKLAKNHRIPLKDINLIYNGIEVNEYAPAAVSYSLRKELGLCDDALLIGAIGRMVAVKGFVYFLQAIKQIEKDSQIDSGKIKYVIVGEGGLRRSLEALSKQLGIDDRVIFLGFRPDTKEIISSFDIFVLSSLYEGQPITLLEAMALAKPVIATEIDGVKETLVNGHNGLLVEPGNSSALAGAIIDLLKHKDKALALAVQARKTVEEKFNLAQKIKQHQELYEEMMSH